MHNQRLIKIIVFLLVIVNLLPFSVSAAIKNKTLTKTNKDLTGRFVIQQEDKSKLWYIDVINKERYLIRDQDDIKLLLDLFNVEVSASDFNKLSKTKNKKTTVSVAAKYRGKFIKFKNNFYYINPGDNLAYYISDTQSFIKTAQIIATVASENLIKKSKLNNKQLTYDPLNSNLAYTSYDGLSFSGGYNDDQKLPLASLTKLMTALIFLETNPDWNKVVTITPEEINYPCTLQACGTTSEIPLKAGDKVKIEDLWIALLTASSNQAAKILVDNSSLTMEEFVAKMNKKSQELGLTKTKFVEVSGLSPNNISTAKEFAKIAKAAFDNFFITLGTNYHNYTFVVEQEDGTPRQIKVVNRNYSLLTFEPQASKTGFLTEAQRNAVIKKDGKIIVVLHALSINERNKIITKLIAGNNLVNAK